MGRWFTATACLLVIATGAAAEIYESRDTEGNPVFSDRPSSGARAIEVPPTNSADPVEPREPTPAPAQPAARKTPARTAAPATGAADERDDDDYLYYGGADNEEARQRLRERRENAADRPRVQPLPSRSRPAAGGGRR